MPRSVASLAQAHKVREIISKLAHLVVVAALLDRFAMMHLLGNSDAAISEAILTQRLRCYLLVAKQLPGVRVYQSFIHRVSFGVSL